MADPTITAAAVNNMGRNRTATRVGTEAIARAVSASQSYSVVGGGDSITAINAIGVTGFDHISTGGGALLALLAYEQFPTVDVVVR